MKSLVNKLLQSLGYVLLHKQELKSHTPIKGLTKFDHANARGKAGIGLDAELGAQGKTNWLEVGTGGRDDDGFIKIDKNLMQKNILKANFYMKFDHPENSNRTMYWKGKILTKIK